MATYTDLMSLFNDIGSAINDKGVNGQHYPYQMASAIRSISTGISVSGTYSVSSAGTFNIASYESVYIKNGGYSLFGALDYSMAEYNYGVSKSSGWYSANGTEKATFTLPSTSISTITPSSTSQVAVSQYRWTLNDVVVEAIPSSYIIPSGTYTVQTTGSGIDIKQYASLNVPKASSPSMSIIFESSIGRVAVEGSIYAGWYNGGGGRYSNMYLPSTSISHITPSTSSQIAVPQYNWTLNEVIVDAIPNTYIIPEGTSTITANGTYDITSFASVSVAIPIGDFINNQENIVVTPTEEEQIVSAAAGYTGLGPVTINGISSTYVGTGVPVRSIISTRTSSQYTYRIDSGYVSVTTTIVMPAMSITTPSITISNATGLVTGITSATTSGYYSEHSVNGTLQLTTQAGYTITPLTVSQIAVPSYRWTTGSVIVDAIPISTILSSAIDGQAYLEDTNNYAFSATITIPEGYYSTTTITRSFSDILPSLSTQATAAQIPLGYEVYDGEGHIITGSMPVNGSITRTLDSTITSVTIPAGYYAESGLVSHTTVAIPSPTFSFNSTTRVITASGNWTRGFTTNNSYTNTYTVTAGTVVPPSTITGTSATLTAGTNTLTFSKTISVTPNVTTAGWISAGTASNVVVSLTAAVSTRTSNSLTASGSTVTVPAGYYATQATKNVASATHPAPTISFNSTTGVITATHTQTAGYVAASTSTSTMNLTTKAASTITPTTSSQTAVAANTYVTGAIIVAAIPSSYKLLSQTTTATSSTMLESVTAYNSNGELITGNVHVITYYTGTSAPTSSLGSNGDIYLQTDGR